MVKLGGDRIILLGFTNLEHTENRSPATEMGMERDRKGMGVRRIPGQVIVILVKSQSVFFGHGSNIVSGVLTSSLT